MFQEKVFHETSVQWQELSVCQSYVKFESEETYFLYVVSTTKIWL